MLQNGYWKKWQTLKGGNAEGTLDWEETWWEASDWTGLKEMGARKEGECVCGDKVASCRHRYSSHVCQCRCWQAAVQDGTQQLYAFAWLCSPLLVATLAASNV